MTIIYRTSLELALEKEVAELRGIVSRSVQAINDFEREVAELKAQLAQCLEQNTLLDKQLAECEKELNMAIPAPSWSWSRAEKDQASW